MALPRMKPMAMAAPVTYPNSLPRSPISLAQWDPVLVQSRW